jgi:1,4-alpha-glucan branching enzyme
MGCDMGQWQEWSEARSLDWHLLEWEPHRKLQRYVADLNRIYTSEPALYERDYDHAGFEWIDLHDSDNSILCYLRRAADPGDYIVIVCNFTPVPRFGYRVGVPEACTYRELLNSDAAAYWGSNLGNAGGFAADPVAWQGRPCSLNLTLPPLSVSFFKPERNVGE